MLDGTVVVKPVTRHVRELLRSFAEDGGSRLKQLLSRLAMGTFRFPKVHPEEISLELLETLGFRPAGGH